jgi:biopolymer transport protein ExbD
MAKHSIAAKRAEMRAQPEEEPEFQIAPMIDILLVLLVFFMSISSTEVLQTNDHVSLPVAKDAKDVEAEDKGKKGQMIINVLWSTIGNAGSLDFNSKTYSNPNELVPLIKSGIGENADTRVLVRADRNVRFEYMKQVLKAVAAAGGSNVTFSVVDKEPGAQPAPKAS